MRDRIATLFQDFTQFHVSARENISWGRWQGDQELAAAQEVAEQAGARVFLEDLPAGFETHLSPEFLGGVELSGGRWQRVALARALFRDAPLLISDEPTASPDPRAEADLFAQVRTLFEGRSVLLITHRIVRAQHADHIYGLDDGRLVEESRHVQVMQAKGR